MKPSPPTRIDDSELLERAARRYEALASSEGSIIWVVSPDLHPTGRNEGWERYTGQHYDDYNGLGWIKAVDPADRARLNDEVTRARQGGQPLTIELRIRRADGVYRQNLIRAVPVVQDAAIVEWIGTATDIEDARQTASELAATLDEQREVRARLFALAEGADALLGRHDEREVGDSIVELAGRVLPADAHALWLFDEITQVWHVASAAGLSARFVAGRVVGSPMTFREPRAFMDLTSLPEDRRKAYQAEGVVGLLSVPLPVRRGRSAALAVCYRSPKRISETELYVGVAFGHIAATALRSAESYLEQSRMRAEAEAANRAKDEFLALLSHELRTPLNAIMGWAHMLRDGLPGEMARHALEVISRNARLQKQLVEDLLDVARILGGPIDLRRTNVDLRDIARATVDGALPVAREKNLVLSLALPKDSASTSADAYRVQQVAANLLSNALKFTEPGGRVHVAVARTDTYVELAVEDTGTGISPEFLPYIFDRFRQADASLTRTHGGLGLGLWFVRQIVEAHGGTVHAESAGLGKGATIRVRFQG